MRLVAVVGILTAGPMPLGFVHINDSDRRLRAGVGAAFVAVGFGARDERVSNARPRSTES